MGFCFNDLKSSCIAFPENFNYIFMHYRCVLYMLNCCVLLGLDWVEPMIFFVCMSHVHAFSCICTFISLYSNILMCLVLFSVSLFLPLSFFWLVASCHLNENPLHPRTLFVLGHPLPLTPLLLTFGSVMRRLVRTSRKTFLLQAFIRNAKSSYRTFSILTFPLSSTVRVESHCTASRSHALP